jgi:hypothetical protein
MTHALGTALLWLASRAGRLGFKLKHGADVTDMVCVLTLMVSPERQRRQTELLERAMASVGIARQVDDVCTDERVNTVAAKGSN